MTDRPLTAAPQRESLFDPPPQPDRCPYCHATRTKGDPRLDDCLHDLERADRTAKLGDWPDGCLNRPDPDTDPIPY